MDPQRRNLLQMNIEDAVSADWIFNTLMGTDVESRRAFIQEHAKDVRFLDI
jgi:DNA gyrase subunit B